MSIPLTTTYLGLELPSPIVVGAAAPLSSDLRRLKQLVVDLDLEIEVMKEIAAKKW